MRVDCLLFLDNLERFSFGLGDANPGVGGTQFTTIQLALRLAKEHPSWRVSLVNTTPVTVRGAPRNLEVTVVDGIDEYLSSPGATEASVILAPVRSIRYADRHLLRECATRTIAWSRHPFDRPLRDLLATVPFAVVVSVGTFQFHSNGWLRRPHLHIPNVFSPPTLDPDTETRPPSSDDLRFVHLGALVRGKGFHHLAEQWPRLRAAFPGATLDVIGSEDVYRVREQHALVPCDPEYATEIIDRIGEDELRNGRVVFHGNLGAEKFDVIRASHIALLNPTGKSEAFPASPLECMWAGRPVIAAADRGMWDTMHHFPELALDDPAEIVDRVSWLLGERERYARMVRRSHEVAEDFRARTPQILRQWETVITATAHGATASLRMPPPPPRPRSRAWFAWQIARRNVRPALARGPAGRMVRWSRRRRL